MFMSNGKIFVIFAAPPLPPISSKFGNVRDESICVQVGTMDDYVMRIKRAVVIIKAYTPARLRPKAVELETISC